MNIRSDTLIPTSAGWTGHLEDGERILWQGRPDARVRIRAIALLTTMLGLPVLAFAVFWTLTMRDVTVGEPVWAWALPALGLPLMLIGLYMVIGHYFWDAFRRGRTWYTLTDRRAFVARNLPMRRKLDTYDIDAATDLEFKDRRGGLGTIWFTGNQSGERKRPSGFEMIGDARRVHKMMRFIQKETV